MTALTRLTIALKLCAFTLVGMWFGVNAGQPLDNIFTGEGTIEIVGLLFGAWAGSMLGGSGWADVAGSFRRRSGSKIAARLVAALALTAGAFAVVRIADSSAVIAGFLLGAAIMAYLLARNTKYRYVFAALLLGVFIGASISAAGGGKAIERTFKMLDEDGIQAVIASSQNGDLRHYYLGRDREEALLIGVILGYMFVGFVTMIVFFALGLIGISIVAFDKRSSAKKKRGGIASSV